MRKVFFIFLTVFLVSLAASGTVFAGELYFNESGDLVFSTYDKKATSGVKYKTVGWVIKRYNDNMYAEGQNYVNIPKSGYIYEIADPDNPEYLYTTFIMDGDTIMNHIIQASGEWKNQLKNYGGYVYIDSIITVCENGTDTGGIYDSGQMYGEVYNTYEGIRNSRDWADGDRLRAYYGLMVKYPCEAKPLILRVINTSVDNKEMSGGGESSFRIGSSSPYNEKYDVSQGIPSGEDLYIYGMADRFRYDIQYQNISGYAYVPVKIKTTYRLKWYDTSGNYHMEDEMIERWYYVKRNYNYVGIRSLKKYDLTGVIVSSECFEDISIDGFSASGGYYKKQYGDSSYHINVNGASEYYVGVVEVNSSNRQRPSIPDDNQQDIAEKMVSELTVWSDRIDINNRNLLSDEKCIKSGKSIYPYVTLPKQTISKNQIMIPKEKENKKDYKSTVKLIYSSGTEKRFVYNTNMNTVTVHTPVAVNLSISGNKNNNENITPSETDLVIGDKFIIYNSSYGNHREIMGYGLRDYMKYVKKRYVRMSFPVVYGTTVYPENTWIEVNSYAAVFCIPEYVKEGNYEIECRTAAINIPSGYSDSDNMESVSENHANININKYCAVNTLQVNVIGKIYGFTVQNSSKRYKTGIRAVFPEPADCSEEMLPLQIQKIENTDSIFNLDIYSNGIGDDTGENIDIDVSYYILEEDEAGNIIRKPVDVYKALDEKFTAGTLLKMEEKIMISMEEMVKVREGVYHFTGNIEIPDKLIIVEKGRDISDIGIKSDYIFYNKMIIVNMDIYGSDENGRKLSYENKENEPQGYCNMWKKEGFNVDKFSELPLECGDVLLIGMEGMMKNSSQIIGTH